jgi:hypothetical protein
VSAGRGGLICFHSLIVESKTTIPPLRVTPPFKGGEAFEQNLARFFLY